MAKCQYYGAQQCFGLGLLFFFFLVFLAAQSY